MKSIVQREYGSAEAVLRLEEIDRPTPDADEVLVRVSAASVDRGTTAFNPGDEVFGTCNGAFAAYARAQPDKLALRPQNLSFEQAAAVPVSAVTALQAVRDRAKVGSGERVLVIGASDGVGTFAVQIAQRPSGRP